MRQIAAERTKQEAEERARKEAEERARKEAEERARKEAEERARKEAEERARKEAERTAKFDSETGFPLNDAARTCCVQRWKHAGLHNDTEVHATSIASTTRIDFEVLSEATNRFNESKYLVGKGASCRVFRAKVYGYPVAVKVFNETAGAWDDKQVSRLTTRSKF